MKKVVFFFVCILLCGLSGCKTSRIAVKTESERHTQRTEVTDSSRTENTTTREQFNAILQSNERQNVVIAFEEWEYYPANTDTTSSKAQGNQATTWQRTTELQSDKPPNAAQVAKHRKGTITINGDRQQTQTTEQSAQTAIDTQTAAKREAVTDEAAKTKAKSTNATKYKNGYVWLIVGLLCAVALIGAGIYIARRRR